MTVGWAECVSLLSGIACKAQTDPQGRYKLSVAGVGPFDLQVFKSGYQQAWKVSAPARDSTADFVLHQHIDLNVFGTTISGTIAGDEFIGGDDIWFGGLCAHTPCQVMEFSSFIGPPRPVEVRLRWGDSGHQLALYHGRGDPEVISLHQPVDRFSGPSELVATFDVSGYYDALAVAFEAAGGGLPAPNDSQSFELVVRPTSSMSDMNRVR